MLPLLWGDFKDGLGPVRAGLLLAPYAYCYRCPLHLTYPDCGIACAEKTRDVISNQIGRRDRRRSSSSRCRAPAGNVIPPPGFLPAVQSHRAASTARSSIADEMITGFGRTGRCGASTTTASCRT